MLHGVWIGFAAVLAASTAVATVVQVKDSSEGALEWNLESAEKICDPDSVVSDRSQTPEDETSKYFIVGDGYSGMPPVNTTWWDNIDGSVFAPRLGATSFDWTLELKLLNKDKYSKSGKRSNSNNKYTRASGTETGWFLTVRPVGAKYESIQLYLLYGYLRAYFRKNTNGGGYWCNMRKTAKTKIRAGEMFQLNVKLVDDKMSLYVNGEVACYPKAVPVDLFETATGVDITWGPYTATNAILFEINRQTSPYPMTDSALCGPEAISNGIQVNYCSMPPLAMPVFGLLASQVGEDGALRYVREGPIPPTLFGNDAELFFREDDTQSLHSLNLFAEQSVPEGGSKLPAYAQCIREVFIDGALAVDFSPGVYVKSDENDGAEIVSTLIETQAPGQPTVYQTVRTVPLSMQLQYPLKTVKLEYGVCDIDGAENLLRSDLQVRALVLNPETDSYEVTQWLKIPAAKEAHLRKRENIYWTIEIPFSEVTLLKFEIDDADEDGYGCLDYVALDGVAAREMSSSWIAAANWRDSLSKKGLLRCGTYECADSAFAIFEYAVCSVEVLNEYATGDAEEKSTSEDNVASASCSNYNRFEKQTCEVSQEFETRSVEETTVHTSSEFVFTASESRSSSRQRQWNNKASGKMKSKSRSLIPFAGKAKKKDSYSRSDKGSESDYSSESRTRSETESTSEGIRHVTEETRNILCAGKATVPSGYKQAYDIVMKRSNYTQEYASDLKLIYCEEMWREGSDANDPANYEIVKNVATKSSFVESEVCDVVFSAPQSLKNAMSCVEEFNEASLNDAKRYVVCNEEDPELYDGCQCNAMDSLRGAFCECVDQSGNLVAGTEMFVDDSWKETCALMNCKDSRFGDGSGAVAAQQASYSSMAAVAGCAASVSLILLYARRRMASAGGDDGAAKATAWKQSYGAAVVAKV